MRLYHVIALSALALALILSSCTKTPLPPVNKDADGIALKGYDPVAYFTQGGPVMGNTRFAYRWNSATWLFSDKEHMEMFMKEPEKYAPRYGGY